MRQRFTKALRPRVDTPAAVADDAEALPDYVEHKLLEHIGRAPLFTEEVLYSPRASAVLFLLARNSAGDNGGDTGPYLILNKRSRHVVQPGDLCCPGGGIAPRLDVNLARLLRLWGSPLVRWAGWPAWRSRRPREAFNLSLLLATGLREGLEEMRLNPFGVRFLGFLPPARLVMFQRTIYPMVCWVSSQKRFTPNWEVEKVVAVPVSRLLQADNYARCVFHLGGSNGTRPAPEIREFPCFMHRRAGRTERLWGATFRITMSFLDLVFGFTPPAVEKLAAVEATLGRRYLAGRPAATVKTTDRDAF